MKGSLKFSMQTARHQFRQGHPVMNSVSDFTNIHQVPAADSAMRTMLMAL
jgi:hypothetical protein